MGTESYDQERLKQVEDLVLKDESRSDEAERERLGKSVISVRDAIDVADGRRKSSGLSAEQLRLVQIVAQERRTESGRLLTDRAAADDVWLAASGRIGEEGFQQRKLKIIVVAFADSKGDRTKDTNGLTETLDHELVHSWQFDVKTGYSPPGLSSYDRKLWALGCEGQAFVAQEVDRRERGGLPGLSDREKGDLFYSAVKEGDYAGSLRMDQSTRSDGRKLTMAEFTAAFGSLPGRKGNFLAGRPGEVDDIFLTPADKKDEFSKMRRAWYEASQKPLGYGELPKGGANVTRVESGDRNTVIVVTNLPGQDKAHVDFYKLKDMPGGGQKYVRFDDKDAAIKGGQAFVVASDWSFDGAKGKVFSVALDHKGVVSVGGTVRDGDKKHDIPFPSFAKNSPEAPGPLAGGAGEASSSGGPARDGDLRSSGQAKVAAAPAEGVAKTGHSQPQQSGAASSGPATSRDDPGKEWVAKARDLTPVHSLKTAFNGDAPKQAGSVTSAPGRAVKETGTRPDATPPPGGR
jgi:hypothetical protein